MRQNSEGPTGCPCCTPSEDPRKWRMAYNKWSRQRGGLVPALTTAFNIFNICSKCIPKVQPKEYIIWSKVAQVDTGCMNSSLSSQWCSISQLAWGQQCSHFTHDLVTGSFSSQAVEGATHCNGAYTPVFSSATRVAPKKKGQMDVGGFPSRTRLMREMRAHNRTAPLPM